MGCFKPPRKSQSTCATTGEHGGSVREQGRRKGEKSSSFCAFKSIINRLSALAKSTLICYNDVKCICVPSEQQIIKGVDKVGRERSAENRWTSREKSARLLPEGLTGRGCIARPRRPRSRTRRLWAFRPTRAGLSAIWRIPPQTA